MEEMKPHWFADHEASDTREFTEIKEILMRMEEKLDPVADAYKTATTLGRWSRTIGASVFLLLSILWVSIQIKSSTVNIPLLK